MRVPQSITKHRVGVMFQWTFLVSMVVAILQSSAFASDASMSALIAKAEASYDGGDYNAAVEEYEKLLKSGLRNGHVYYNLGQAFYKSGKSGQAMAAFLAARRLLPRNPDVKANIEFIRQKLTDRLEVEKSPSLLGTLLFWTKLFTPLELWRIAAILLALLCFIYGYLVLKSAKGPVRIGFGAAFGLPALIAISAVVTSVTEVKWGAVTGKEAVVYSGPADQNPVLFQLNEGAPFIYRQTSGEWLQISLTDGKKGWIKKQVALVY